MMIPMAKKRAAACVFDTHFDPPPDTPTFHTGCLIVSEPRGGEIEKERRLRRCSTTSAQLVCVDAALMQKGCVSGGVGGGRLEGGLRNECKSKESVEVVVVCAHTHPHHPASAA
jgi:hypothetical protein